MAGGGGRAELDSMLLQLGQPNLVTRSNHNCIGRTLLRLVMCINKSHFHKNCSHRLALLTHLINITNSFSKTCDRHRGIHKIQ